MVKPDVKVNYYAALEVGSDASVEDIKKQYRKLALKYHPDRNPGKEEEFNSKFQAISAAHEILCDPSTKAAYD
ncbi:DnaJ domain-containing protein, partial [Elsinoe ampelina]